MAHFAAAVPYGPETVACLRERLSILKAGDPLTPITVIVPANYTALSLRHQFGREGKGIVNTRFFILHRLAELLGASTMSRAGRVPLTAAVRSEAVRAILHAAPGSLAAVCHHAATVRSLAATFEELAHADSASLTRLAVRGGRTADVVRLYRDYTLAVRHCYDKEALCAAAAAAVEEQSPALADIGHTILYLPHSLAPGASQLCAKLWQCGRLDLIAGVCGEPAADAETLRIVERITGAGASQIYAAASGGQSPEESLSATTSLISAPDPEEEIREVVRAVVRRVEEGKPLYRMAVASRNSEPYIGIAHERLEAAGIPFCGPGLKSLAQSMAGRLLLGAWNVREAGFTRSHVMDWLCSTPIRNPETGFAIPASHWDRLSREAGITQDPAQWRSRLERYATAAGKKRDHVLREQGEDAPSLRRLQEDVGECGALSRFITGLEAALICRDQSRWSALAQWSRDLLENYLDQTALDTEEEDALRQTERALNSLSSLDALGAQPDEAAFVRAASREMEASLGRAGAFGSGVFVGRISDMPGMEFDVLFLVGMNDGTVPARGADDPLLPDYERMQAEAVMPLRSERHEAERHNYLAALASSPERVLLYARSDLRGSRKRMASRWLVEMASAQQGELVFASEIEALKSDAFALVPSFALAVSQAATPASAEEYYLRSMARFKAENREISTHWLVTRSEGLADGLAAEAARRGSAYTRWDGWIPGNPLPLVSQTAFSASGLEEWSLCPFRYFVRRVLRVDDCARPEDTTRIDGATRGALIHTSLEMFFRAVPTRIAPDQPWSGAERQQLSGICNEILDAHESAAGAGRSLLWQLDRRTIRRDLEGFLDADEAIRSALGCIPERVENFFGGDTGSRVEITAGHVTLRFQGKIDRVDRVPATGALVAFDYKSGSRTRYKNLENDPVCAGTTLQPHIYAEALRAGRRAPVQFYYWFVSEDQEYISIPVETLGPAEEAFHTALETIVTGISEGRFPPRPGVGSVNCDRCAYVRMCATDRERAWERRINQPGLEPYLALIRQTAPTAPGVQATCSAE